jgi:TolA-binding protein
MKTSERHHLKENEFAITVARLSEAVVGQQRPLLIGAVVIVIVAVAGGGYWFWQHQTLEKASGLLATAQAIATAPVTPPQLPTIGQPAPALQAGSFPTEAARDAAALTKFREAAAAYPDTKPGLAAQFQVGTLLADSGKLAEAEQAFNEIVRRDANGLYGRMARLGIAALHVRTGKLDSAIQTFQELSQRTDTDLPLDGILMQLGDAYRRAGRTPEAIRAYTRIVDEYPESAYVGEARNELDQLRGGGAAPRS